MPEAGLQRLGQGSRIRTRSRGGSGRVETRSSENGTKVCGRAGYSVEVFRRSLGREDTWVRVPVLHGV